MEIPVHEEINELDPYTEGKLALSGFDFSSECNDAKIWQNNWFAMNEPCDEEGRIWAVVALLVYELEHENITPEMIGELEYYYNEVFIENNFDNVFEELDAKEKCFADLKWCYDIAVERGLIEKMYKREH